MKKTPTAYFFVGGEGMSSYHCKTKEQALEAFKELWADDTDYFEEKYGAQEITIDRIQQERYFTHKACGAMTFGEGICHECGESCGTVGRKTFVIYF